VFPGTPGLGEMGALDAPTVLISSTGAVAAIKTLPEFIRSRRSGFRIETTVNGQPFILDATDVDEVMPIVDRLVGGRSKCSPSWWHKGRSACQTELESHLC